MSLLCQVDDATMRKIASYPPETHYYFVNDYSQISKVLLDLTMRSCAVAQGSMAPALTSTTTTPSTTTTSTTTTTTTPTTTTTATITPPPPPTTQSTTSTTTMKVVVPRSSQYFVTTLHYL